MNHAPLSPVQTQALLDALGHSPNKRLGQNFLIDGNIVRKSLSLADVLTGDVIVEVGPGLGTLTRALLTAGADVFAIEYDRTLYHHLSHTLSRAHASCHIMQGDAVNHPLGPFKGNTPFKIVANLPYAIATPWLEKVLAGPLPQKMVLMLQKEAADRFMAQPGTKNYGAISIFLAAAYEQKAGHNVAKQCFYPVPKVDSVLLHIEKKPNPFLFSSTTRQLIRQLFTQRRKQIVGLIKKMAPQEKIQPWLNLLEANNLTHARAETIPLPIWKQLNAVN